MAWAEQLPSGNYRACWRDSSGKQRSTTRDKYGQPLTQKKAAEQRAAVMEDDAAGKPASTGAYTWGQWCDRWWATRKANPKLQPGTLRADLGRIEHHLKPRWAKARLGRIDRETVQDWVNQLATDEDLSGSTVRRIYYLMSASMKAAVKAGLLPVNPCNLIDLPDPIPGHERYLTRTEFWAIADELDYPYRDAAILLVFTGMRFGEMAGLHWDRIDLDRQQVTVAETWDRVSGRVKAFPKSKKPRTVPLAEPVVTMLKGLTTDRKTCGNPHTKDSRCTSPLVITSVTGLPLDYSTMGPAFKLALDLAGIEERTTLHDLRHTFASWLIQAGVSIRTVQVLMGHGSVAVTERYAHLDRAQYDQVRDVLGG